MVWSVDLGFCGIFPSIIASGLPMASSIPLHVSQLRPESLSLRYSNDSPTFSSGSKKYLYPYSSR